MYALTVLEVFGLKRAEKMPVGLMCRCPISSPVLFRNSLQDSSDSAPQTGGSSRHKRFIDVFSYENLEP